MATGYGCYEDFVDCEGAGEDYGLGHYHESYDRGDSDLSSDEGIGLYKMNSLD